MNKIFLMLGTVVFAVHVPSVAATTDVATFLANADKLEKLGLRAMFASEGKLMMRQLEDAGRGLRAERLAAQAAGKRPAYCPTAKNRADARELVAALRTIPTTSRANMQLRDALRSFYVRRYPCPA